MPGKAGERREWLGSRCIFPLPAAERGGDTAPRIRRWDGDRFSDSCRCVPVRACLDALEVACVGTNGGGYAGARPNIQRKAEKERRIIGSQQGICRPSAEKLPGNFRKTEIFLHATRPKRTFFIIFAPEKSVQWRTMDRSSEAEKAIRRDELAKEKGEEERKGAGFKKSAKKC